MQDYSFMEMQFRRDREYLRPDDLMNKCMLALKAVGSQGLTDKRPLFVLFIQCYKPDDSFCPKQ